MEFNSIDKRVSPSLPALTPANSEGRNLFLEVRPGEAFGFDPSSLFKLSKKHGQIAKFQINNATAPHNSFLIELFDQNNPRATPAPKTVANFIDYINDGESYQNTIIHRSIENFVLQGGGWTISPSNEFILSRNTPRGPINNEPFNSNVAGTLSMAKVGSNPNSATNQWFINIGDNSNNLDSQNGGFSAFGNVLADGMETIRQLSKIPRNL